MVERCGGMARSVGRNRRGRKREGVCEPRRAVHSKGAGRPRGRRRPAGSRVRWARSKSRSPAPADLVGPAAPGGLAVVGIFVADEVWEVFPRAKLLIASDEKSFVKEVLFNNLFENVFLVIYCSSDPV